MNDKSQHQPATAPKHFSRARIIKNVAAMCGGVVLLFTAYDGLAMLQSTMNHEQGIGVISQTVAYLCFCVSAVLLPKYVIKKLGSKATFALSILTILPYVASNFYFHWILVIPTSILIGLGSSLLWGAQATYLNDISLMYAEMTLNANEQSEFKEDGSHKDGDTKKVAESSTKLPLDANYLNFAYKNDMKNIVLKSCKSIEPKRYNIPTADTTKPTFIPTSNLHQYVDSVRTKQMNEGYPKKTKTPEVNNLKPKESCCPKIVESSQKQQQRRKVIESITARFFGFHGVAYLSSHIWSNLVTYSILQSDVSVGNRSNASCSCGAAFCNVESLCYEQNIAAPSDRIRFILTAACVSFGVLSVLIVVFFLDPLETEKEEVSFSKDLLIATYKLTKKKRLVLLIPSSFYIGMVQGFYVAEFNKSFVACAWGTYHVGLVAMCYGAVSGVSSFSSGWLVKHLGRIPIFVAATLTNLAASVFLLRWRPDAEQPHLFFVAAGMWAVYVGVIWSQLRAFYGVLFKKDEEAAFAAFHVWYSLGYALSFAYSSYFCVFVKIYALMAVCLLGFTGYLAVEIMHSRNKDRR